MTPRPVGVRGEATIVATNPFLRTVGVLVAVAALVVGFVNSQAREQVRADLATIESRQAAVTLMRDSGITVIDGAPINEELRALDAAATRARLDLHFGSVLGASEAILGLAATAPGAILAIVLGAFLTGRDFERRTWFYELTSGDRRMVRLRKTATALSVLVTLLSVGVTLAAVGAALGGLLVGSAATGAPRGSFLTEVAAALLVLTLWSLVGLLGGLVTTRFLGGVAAGLGLMAVDAAISLNLPTWGPYLLTPRITGVARLWAPTSPVFLVTGRTTSLMWWSTFTGVPGYTPAEGAWVIALYIIGLWVLVGALLRHLPWRASG